MGIFWECEGPSLVCDIPKILIVFLLKYFEGGDDESSDIEQEGQGDEDEEPKYNKQLMPEFVFSLQATDDFLCDRVMTLPESLIQNTHYTEEHMLRRLYTFHYLNTEEDGVLNFFDENEIHPNLIDITDDDTPNMEKTFEILCQIIGSPRNLGPSKAVLELMLQEAELKALRDKEASELEKAKLEAKMKAEYLAKMERWSQMMLQFQKEEYELLAVEGEPLRSYLMKYVFPTLTKGLLEVSRLKPDDPVDYLAEYLFKENPEGRMFDPAYNAAAGEFMEAVQNLQNAIFGKMDDLDELRDNAESGVGEKICLTDSMDSTNCSKLNNYKP